MRTFPFASKVARCPQRAGPILPASDQIPASSKAPAIAPGGSQMSAPIHCFRRWLAEIVRISRELSKDREDGRWLGVHGRFPVVKRCILCDEVDAIIAKPVDEDGILRIIENIPDRRF